MNYDYNHSEPVMHRVGDKWVLSEYSDWHKEFLFYPRIFSKKLHWFSTVYWRTNYVKDKFEYKTKKEFLFDELRGKN